MICPSVHPPPSIPLHHNDPNTEEYGHKLKRSIGHLLCLVERPQFHRQKGGKTRRRRHPRCVCTVALITMETAVRESGRCRTALICRVSEVFLCLLAPVVAQLGPGDGHLVPTGGAHFWREVDDAAVVLHILKLVLLGGLHVDH